MRSSLLLLALHLGSLGQVMSLSLSSSKSSSSPTTGRNKQLITDALGTKLFYDLFVPEMSSDQAVLYLPCLSRAKNNAKASNLEMFCKRTGRNFVCADYYGVGRSEGSMETACLSRWCEDTEKLMMETRPGQKVRGGERRRAIETKIEREEKKEESEKKDENNNWRRSKKQQWLPLSPPIVCTHFYSPPKFPLLSFNPSTLS